MSFGGIFLQSFKRTHYQERVEEMLFWNFFSDNFFQFCRLLDEFQQAAARVLEQLTGLKVSIWSSYRLLEILAAIQWSEVFLLPTLLLLVFINMKSSSVIIIMLFPLGRIPRLIFDHEEMVERAKQSCNIKQPWSDPLWIITSEVHHTSASRTVRRYIWYQTG